MRAWPWRWRISSFLSSQFLVNDKGCQRLPRRKWYFDVSNRLAMLVCDVSIDQRDMLTQSCHDCANTCEQVLWIRVVRAKRMRHDMKPYIRYQVERHSWCLRHRNVLMLIASKCSIPCYTAVSLRGSSSKWKQATDGIRMLSEVPYTDNVKLTCLCCVRAVWLNDFF